MSCRDRRLVGATGRTVVAPLLAVVTLAAGALAFGAPSLADVSPGGGGAYGFFANVSLFGGPAGAKGPEPSVELPAGGSSTPVTATQPTGVATYGPATLFKSGQLEVSTNTGTDGSVTSSASVQGLANRSEQYGPFLYDRVRSSCTGAVGSTTISGGVLETKYDAASQKPIETKPVPVDPAPNTALTGTIDHVGESFRIVFNEQTKNPDGSVTVNGAHLYLLGPTAVGDLVIAQARCGIALPRPATPATVTTPSSPPATVTTPSSPLRAITALAFSSPSGATAVAGARTTGVAALLGDGRRLAAAAAQASGGGGAYGFFSNVSLFGGPAGAKGPEPIVELPAGGSTSPVTGSQPTGVATYGPATLFKSGQLDASTNGTTGAGGSVTSSASVQGLANRADQFGPFLYDRVRSTCTGAAGSTTINGGVLETKYDANTQDPIETKPVPVDPAPNTEFTGTIDHVGDSYRVVFNEQTKNPDGSVTVNAAHLYLLGPTAVGDLVIAQSRCGIALPGPTNPGSVGTASSAKASSTVAGASTGRSGSASSSGTRLATTGADTPIVPGLVLLGAGLIMRHWANRRPRGDRR